MYGHAAIIKMSVNSLEDFNLTETLSTKGRKSVIRVLKAELKRGVLDGDKQVVLKTFTSHKYSLVQDALGEARLLMSVEHPQICKMYDCFTERQGQQFCFAIVMEYFSKGDLEDEIYRRKLNADYWSEADLFDITSGLVDALASLQRKRVCHRDIKPHNIFYKQGLTFKLGDFGVSKKELTGATATQKTLVGTPLYFSPLCAKAFLQLELGGQTTVTHDMYKSDVFSLGLTFLRMASLKSVRGLNTGVQGTIDNRVKGLGCSSGYKHVLMQMLRIDETERLDFLSLERLLDQAKGYCILKPVFEKQYAQVQEVEEDSEEEPVKDAESRKAMVKKKRRSRKKTRVLPDFNMENEPCKKEKLAPRDISCDATMSTLSLTEEEDEVLVVPEAAPDSLVLADNRKGGKFSKGLCDRKQGKLME
jgi:serine/threonine protein kinase